MSFAATKNPRRASESPIRSAHLDEEILRLLEALKQHKAGIKKLGEPRISIY